MQEAYIICIWGVSVGVRPEAPSMGGAQNTVIVVSTLCHVRQMQYTPYVIIFESVCPRTLVALSVCGCKWIR